MDEKTIIQHLIKIGDDVGLLRAEVATNTQITKSVEEQAKKTNGRVSKLEEEHVDLKRISDQQHVLVSKLNGAFKAHQQWTEEKIKSSRDFQDREIDELKKYHSDEIALDKSLKLEKEGANTKVKVTIWGTISACILATLTWLFK
jgi:predicted RNase H-like nuclease (RuvC/YqgF family)